MRVVFLVIVNLSVKRWQDEFSIWSKVKRRMEKRYPNVDVLFLECNKRGIFCVESYSPGIFQKTIQGLELVKNKYDLYIRTNLSTFFNMPNLFEFVESLGLTDDKPLYGGTYQFTWGISGSGIFMNNTSVHLLLKHGSFRKYYLSSKPDDVVIGEIMRLENVSMDPRFPYMPMWNKEKDFDENMRTVSSAPYVRMIDAGFDMFNRLVEKT